MKRMFKQKTDTSRPRVARIAASPVISTANGILNLGFENDPIYKPLSLYNDFSSSLDHLDLATSQYIARQL